MARSVTKVVILAAGMGTRMRRNRNASQLSDEQQRVARTGVKALIPVGRPFLDYLLHRAANAGLVHICLVVGPDHESLRRYYGEVPRQRVNVEFALQREPLGTADALAAAQRFVGEDDFVALNSDNCYPTQALCQLRAGQDPAVIGFDREALSVSSGLTAERIARFALLESDEVGDLRCVVEKPPLDRVRRMTPPILVGMNCWRFAPSIFESCRQIDKSARGEYEIPDAVNHSIRELGVRYRVFASPGPVLDLSSQQDISTVQRSLRDEEVEL